MRANINSAKNKVICALLILIMCIIFNSPKTVKASENTWNLHFENVQVAEGSINAIKEPTIGGSSNSELTYSLNLSTPGEFYEFTVDAVNGGNMDAIVNDLSESQLTIDQKKYLRYEVTYIDGTEVKKDDMLNAGARKTLKIRLEFKKDITADDLPHESTTIFLSLNALYVQANAYDEDTESAQSMEPNKQEEEQNNQKSDFIKNAKTGDIIISYVVILVLAVIAFVIAKSKSKTKE